MFFCGHFLGENHDMGIINLTSLMEICNDVPQLFSHNATWWTLNLTSSGVRTMVRETQPHSPNMDVICQCGDGLALEVALIKL